MSHLLSKQNIVFIGAGSMAEAIIRGLVMQQKVSPEQVYVFNRSNNEKLSQLKERYNVQISSDPTVKKHAIANANVIIFAMKPVDAAKAFLELREQLTKDKLIISVIAGLSIATMQVLLEDDVQIARTMPNTSSSIGLGATGVCFSESTSPLHRDITLEIFSSVGEVTVVEESQLDILTGVSGSGPAYVYYLMEAMISGGVKGGLSEEEARRLTIQTVLGAASMVKVTQENPADLRRKVTSPNGTTQAALEKLDAYCFVEAMEHAILRAAERSAELGVMIRDNALNTF